MDGIQQLCSTDKPIAISKKSQKYLLKLMQPELLSQKDLLPSVKKPQKLHLNFLDGLRGFAAFYVVLHHLLRIDTTNGMPNWLIKVTRFTEFGHTMVAIFIVLSGFSLMLPVALSENHQIRGGFGEYIKRRSLRILPAYYSALLLSLVGLLFTPAGIIFLQGGNHKILNDKAFLDNFQLLNLLAHVLLLHNLYPQWSFSINMALWSVATEWQIYFLFPLILLPIWRRFGNASALVVGFGLGLIPSLFPLQDVQGACFWYVGLFALGQVSAAFAVSRFLRPDANIMVANVYQRKQFSGNLLMVSVLLSLWLWT